MDQAVDRCCEDPGRDRFPIPAHLAEQTNLVALSLLFDHMRRFLLKSMVCRWLAGLCGAVLAGFRACLALERQ